MTIKTTDDQGIVQYAVIRNPQNWLARYEVWYSGMGDVRDERTGYLTREFVIKPVTTFLTRKWAEDYIQYQKDVRAFKEAV